jgi:HD-GYP domain-containing protein (c-di-GMP phosphodiesterase class II)
LELYNRSPLEPDAEWKNILETLADQTAIAVDNALLFEELQKMNINLLLAYDAAIEGWAKALDLRSYESPGHTQRLAERTVKLASALGVPENDLVYIRRGALLHDIGMMGIPDTILSKLDPLTEEEWALIRRHPQIAQEMLSMIAYLQPALEIPYSHHERWNGSGYPRGLEGEEIPLAARIFAVVDVWDALTSDRPYRKAWTREAAREYLEQNKGILFDPRVVDVFLRLIDSESAL